MKMKEEYIDFLMRIKQYEVDNLEQVEKYGWTWRDVQSPPFVVHALLINGLISCVFQSNKNKTYKLTDAGRSFEVYKEEPAEHEVDMSSLFADIVGYNNVKEVLRESLQLEKPIHVLLHGGPAIAKSMFLYDIERVGGPSAMTLLGSATSHAGLWDLLAERKPKWVLVDEIDKMSLVDMAGLLSLMEQGRIIRAKVGRKLDVQLDCCVVAAANRVSKLPPELLSRFAKFHLGEYNTGDFITVVENVLVKRENMSDSDAHEVATRLVGFSHDVRDAIRVARLASRTGVQKAIELLAPALGA